nr:MULTISPECIES: sugar ABC transporter permease [unclassified Clostridium]
MRRTRQCCIFRNREHTNPQSGNCFKLHPRNMRPWLFLAPSLAGTAIFVLIPFVNVVARSFFQAVGGQFVGMENFMQVFHSQAFRLAVKNTLHFILVCIPALMAFSLWAAVLVTSAADNRGLYKATILLPMAIPVASVVLLWKLLLYPQGLLDQMVVGAGGTGRDWLNQDSAFYILVLTYIWKNTGYDMMLWLAGLDGIPKELFEAAKVDGAGAWQSFYYVALPGLRSTCFLVLVLSVINSFKVFREAYLISGDYPHESIYMLQHLFNHWFVSLDIQKMSAASVMVESSILIPVLFWTWKRKKR